MRHRFLWLLLLLIVPVRARADEAFSAIDKHALAAPADVEKTVPALAAYLTKPAKSDVEKARAIYRWITDRIAYDADSFFKGLQVDGKPTTVLATRKAVCAGYVNLFEALAKEAGLKTTPIDGFAKGVGYGVSDNVTGSNHAWDAVFLEGKWQLVDTTWGAGYLKDKAFVKRFDDFFFLTPPRLLIYSRLPRDPKWQLLDPPIDAATFAKLPAVKPEFFQLDLNLVNHKEASFETKEQPTILIEASADVVISATLSDKAGPVEGNRILTQRKGKEFELKFAIPKSGTYQVHIFAGKENSPGGKLDGVLEYEVHANLGKDEPREFPELYIDFLNHSGYLEAPLYAPLEAGKKQAFKVRVPGAAVVSVLSGGKEVPLQKQGNGFAGSVLTAAGDIIIMAGFPSNPQRLAYLVKYQAK